MLLVKQSPKIYPYLLKFPLHNLQTFILFCNSFLSVMFTKSSGDNFKKCSSKKLKSQIMATLKDNKNNDLILKADSQATSSKGPSGIHIPNMLENASGNCSRSTYNKYQESIKSNTKRSSTAIKATYSDLREVVTGSVSMDYNFQRGQVPLPPNMAIRDPYRNSSVPLFYSFSDFSIPQQHFNMTHFTQNGLNNRSNDNFMSRSHVTGSSNWTTEAAKDKRVMWSLRTWQRTPLGKKLSNQKNHKKSCKFTVMSYNVLAQELLTEHPYLYHNHHPRALQWELRWQNLLSEIKEHDADILCLQEVQSSHLENYFSKLKDLGYDGLFKQRTGFRTDGCAIYYKISKFNLVEYTTVEFNQSNILVLNRDNVAIIAKFSPKHNPKNEFVVTTTHLLYNPKREDVRLAQTQVLLSEIDRISFKQGNLAGIHSHVPIIITGDFNLSPSSPVYDLIVNGYLQYEHLSNKSLSKNNKTSSTGKHLLPSFLRITDECKHADLMELRKGSDTVSKEEELQHIHLQHSERSINKTEKDLNHSLFSTGTLTHDLALKSAYEHRRGNDDEATTFQDKWVTVDYVFYSGVRDKQDNLVKDGKLKLISRYVLPTGSQLKGIKIPNFVVASDHLPLIVRFQLDP